MGIRIHPMAAAIALAFSASTALAQTPQVMEDIVVNARRDNLLPGGQSAAPADLARGRASTSDTASLLKDIPGLSLYGAGGVSSLPAIHGLADDRLRIKVDGMDLIASCPNHMNPALSYVDPSNVGKVQAYLGVPPVSVGGDSIGSTIIVESIPPEFASSGNTLIKGEVGTFYRSNGDARGGNVSVTAANDSFSIRYAGSTAKAENYTAGGNFKTSASTGRPGQTLPLDEVGSTAYETANHVLDMALKGGNHLLTLSLGYQDMPKQLYPNQRMDLLNNEQKRINLSYIGDFEWGKLQARAYHEKVDHYMDFGADKKYEYGPLGTVYTSTGIAYSVPGMPMYTRSTTNGLSLQGDVNVSNRDIVRIGALLQTYRLDDWWPPSPNCGIGNCIGGMAPYDFLNINDGERDRKGIFAEWEANWSKEWTSLLGLRFERVTTDTGDVHGYNDMNVPGTSVGGSVGSTNIPAGRPLPQVISGMGMPMGMMYATSSVGTLADFNNLDRKRSDNNIDFTALVRHTPDELRTFELGFAQKTRSPNLYERYSWSRNPMALIMNNFVGDGNGYLGDPNLKPEVAHTLSASGHWRSADRESEIKVTPYFTHVRNYIDAVQWNRTSNTAANPVETNNFVIMKYANQTARLYGIDLSGKMPLANSAIGALGLKGMLSYVRGKNTETHDDLYNIMPLNGKIALTQKIGGFDNTLELLAVKGKSDVSDARNEIKTPGYSLVNFRGSYSWQNVRVDFGVENLFDRKYFLPLGGAYTGQGTTMSQRSTDMPWGIAVPGMGRSLYAGLNIKF